MAQARNHFPTEEVTSSPSLGKNKVQDDRNKLQDTWLAEYRYYATLLQQHSLFQRDYNTLEEMFESAMNAESYRRYRLTQILCSVVEQQLEVCLEECKTSRPVSSLPSAPVIDPSHSTSPKEKEKYTWNREMVLESAARIEAFEDQKMYYKSLYTDISPLDSENMVFTTVVSRRDVSRIHAKPALIIVTRDQYVHLYDLPPMSNSRLGSLDADTACDILIATASVGFDSDNAAHTEERLWTDQLIPTVSFCTLDEGIAVEPHANGTRINIHYNYAQQQYQQRLPLQSQFTTSARVVLEVATFAERSELLASMQLPENDDDSTPERISL
jgi:hypothetical protein